MTHTNNDSSSAPLVSIIIPAYNVAAYIGDALASVFKQDFKDYEVIVVNDGSPDTEEFERVIAPWRASLVYLKQANQGPSAARNTGIRAARGTYVAFLDADDLWEPNYLAVHVGMMERDSSIAVLYPDAWVFGEDIPAGKRFTDSAPSDGEVTLEALLTERCTVMVGVTARREWITKVGMFDEALRGSEDFDLWLRVIHAGGRICYHRQPLVHYRRHPGSLSSDTIYMQEYVLRVFDKVERTMRLTESEQRALVQARRRFQALLQLQRGKRAFFNGDTAGAIGFLTEANRILRRRKLAMTVLLLRLVPGVLKRFYEARDRFVFGMNTKS